MERSQSTIKVIGVGGCGINILGQLLSRELQNVTFIAMSPDISELERTQVAHKIQLGPKARKGQGCGSNSDAGLAAAFESAAAIKAAISDAKILFLIGGLGGGSASGALPFIAYIAAQQKIFTVALVTRPFTFEGVTRSKTADAAIQNIQNHASRIISVQNDDLLKFSQTGDTFMEMINKCDTIFYNAIKLFSNFPKQMSASQLQSALCFAETEVVEFFIQ